MYKLVKAAGNNSTVILRREEDMYDLEVGLVSVELLNILEEAGYSFRADDGGMTIKSEWNLEITSTETKDKISRLALPIKKPLRVHKPNEQKKEEKVIDAMDVLLGLASFKNC
jgi:hypothetical protein